MVKEEKKTLKEDFRVPICPLYSEVTAGSLCIQQILRLYSGNYGVSYVEK